MYGLGLEFPQAVTISLVIVGAAALYGAARQARAGGGVWSAGAILGPRGIFTAPVGASVGAQLPEHLSLFMFAGLMMVIGIRMHSNTATRTTIAGVME